MTLFILFKQLQVLFIMSRLLKLCYVQTLKFSKFAQVLELFRGCYTSFILTIAPICQRGRLKSIPFSKKKTYFRV